MIRLWFRAKAKHNNNDSITEGILNMGDNWKGHTRPVRAVPAITDADHDDFIAQERKRATELVTKDRAALAAAITKFNERFRAFPELAGHESGTPKMLDELRELDHLWSMVSLRASIIRGRSEHRLGMFTTLEQAEYEAPSEEALEQAAGRLSAALGQSLATEDETCTNGEDGPVLHCLHCDAALTLENDLLVDRLSGDAGGTYDYCPVNPTHVHQAAAGTTK